MRRLLACSLVLQLLAAPALATRGPAKASEAYAAQVRAKVDERLGDMVTCMDPAKVKPGTRVKIKVQVLITSDGAVSSAKRAPGGKSSNPAIETCMLRLLARWKFPAPADRQTVVVEFPIELESAK